VYGEVDVVDPSADAGAGLWPIDVTLFFLEEGVEGETTPTE